MVKAVAVDLEGMGGGKKSPPPGGQAAGRAATDGPILVKSHVKRYIVTVKIYVKPARAAPAEGVVKDTGNGRASAMYSQVSGHGSGGEEWRPPYVTGTGEDSRIRSRVRSSFSG